MTPRRGVTLPELLLALTMLLIGLAVGTTVLRMTSDATRRALRARDAARDATVVWGVATRDLRFASNSDIHLLGPTTLEYTRPIAEGEVCERSGDLLRIARTRWLQSRLPDPAGDRIWLHDGSTPGTWVERGIVSVSVAICPDSSPALQLHISGGAPAATLVRVVTPLRLRRYLSAGNGWLGLEPQSGGVIQPIAGPIAPGGLRLSRTDQSLTLEFATAGAPALQFILPLGPPP